mmetsp:Transcript_29504/g.95165  ORF Transcript_29504/g.95165 Transcript_29504/m.95165 type:complete len:243 (-) Transcript_29504:154-882(-)
MCACGPSRLAALPPGSLVVVLLRFVARLSCRPASRAGGATARDFAVLDAIVKVDETLQAELVGNALGGVGPVDPGQLARHLAALAQKQHRPVGNLDHGLHHGRAVGVEVCEEGLEVDVGQRPHQGVHQLGEVARKLAAAKEDHRPLMVRKLGQQLSLICQGHVHAVAPGHPFLPLLGARLHLGEPVSSQRFNLVLTRPFSADGRRVGLACHVPHVAVPSCRQPAVSLPRLTSLVVLHARLNT